MSERTVEDRVADLEEAVSGLLEALAPDRRESPGEALERLHQRFQDRLRGQP